MPVNETNPLRDEEEESGGTELEEEESEENAPQGESGSEA
jgi:hypothetical protein